MPYAALPPCAAAGCTARVAKGRCQRHQQEYDRRRREQRPFNYASKWWRLFRGRHFARLVEFGVKPICGAVMPAGPKNPERLSACLAEGRWTFMSETGSLHLHHEPPLQKHELSDREAILNSDRIVLLCRSCHSRHTEHRSYL